MLTLDFVARRYGMLPSHLLREGSSLDFVIADAAQGYENFLRERAEKGNNTPIAPDLTEDQMLDMIKKVKEQA